MNSKEYIDYIDRVNEFFKKEGVSNLSPIDINSDGYFSKSPCEVCRRPLAGARVDCNGWNDTTETVQGPYSVCEDCEYYAAYGRLDDLTMLEVEESKI
jgi:hypothetical protein